MKRLFFFASFTAAVFAAAFAAESGIPIDLLRTGEFRPVVMGGEATAAFGWYMRDQARERAVAAAKRYVSGEECFKLEFKDLALIIRFKEVLPEGYCDPKAPIRFCSSTAFPQPPAPRYRTRGRILLDKGKVVTDNRHAFSPAPDWQEFDYAASAPLTRFDIYPAPGMRCGFAALSCEAEYPKIGGEIALPDGGQLTRLLLPADATFVERWSVALWRGWLWELTGVALPVETVKSADAAAPGALALIRDKSLTGYAWRLTVDRNGIALRYGDHLALSPALFDYLRMGLGCGFYSGDCIKRPVRGSVAQLPAIDRTVKPRCGVYFSDVSWSCMSGAIYYPLFHSWNDCDYYHQPTQGVFHVVNVMLPREKYEKTHPEYYMMNAAGKRSLPVRLAWMNACMTNPDAVKVMVDRLVDYAKGQSNARFINFDAGDIHNHCVCPRCVEFNRGRGSCTDAQLEFANHAVPALAKAVPGTTLTRLVYASHRKPPTHVVPKYENILYHYCFEIDLLPCTLHTDCEINRAPFADLAAWAKIAGKPERMGFAFYRDLRPLPVIRILERFADAGNAFFMTYYWKGFSPANNFVLPRWNLGEDPAKLLEEFDLAYYGKGGAAVHRVNLLVDEYARNYRHSADEIARKGGFRHLGVWGSNLGTRTVLDRATLDRIYALFDEALAAAGDDRVARRHILREKSFYLAEDLIRHNRASCTTEEEELAFARRLGTLAKEAREFPGTFGSYLYDVKGRELVLAASGIEIPDTGVFWADEPKLRQLLDDPKSAFRIQPESVPGGFLFKPTAFKSASRVQRIGYLCPPRYAVVLTRPAIGRDRLAVEFELAAAPVAPLSLAIEGQDDEKPGGSACKVVVNGRELFAGTGLFPEHSWGRLALSIPAEMLKAGTNVVEVLNTTPDKPSRSERYTDPELAASDEQWGWISISEIVVLDPNGDFRRAAAGEPFNSAHWRPVGAPVAGGKITAKGGKVVFSSSAPGELHWQWSPGHMQKPFLAVTPRGKVRVTIKGSGSGQLRAMLQLYHPYRIDKEKKTPIFPERGHSNGSHYYGAKSPVLTPTDGVYTHTFNISKVPGLALPGILWEGPGEFTVTDFKMEVLPPPTSPGKPVGKK